MVVLSLHAHLNCIFAHFILFNDRFRLIDEKETEILHDLVVALKLHPDGDVECNTSTTTCCDATTTTTTTTSSCSSTTTNVNTSQDVTTSCTSTQIYDSCSGNTGTISPALIHCSVTGLSSSNTTTPHSHDSQGLLANNSSTDIYESSSLPAVSDEDSRPALIDPGVPATADTRP